MEVKEVAMIRSRSYCAVCSESMHEITIIIQAIKNFKQFVNNIAQIHMTVIQPAIYHTTERDNS